eukprot:3219982-Prymnesium_polylepis.1
MARGRAQWRFAKRKRARLASGLGSVCDRVPSARAHISVIVLHVRTLTPELLEDKVAAEIEGVRVEHHPVRGVLHVHRCPRN